MRRNGFGHQCGGAWLMVLPAVVGLVHAAAAADDTARMPGGSAAPAVLDLPGAGMLAGRLVDSPADQNGARSSFLWQSPAFTRPFEFAVDGIVGIRFPPPQERHRVTASGAWVIGLESGDELVGRIESIDDRHVVATIGPAGAPTTVTVRREHVKRMYGDEAGTIRVGVGGLANWHQGKPGTWREQGGRLIAAAPGAMLFRDFEAGDRMRYDLSLSWQQRPVVQIAVGLGAAKDAPGGYRLELRREGMVAVREEKGSGGTDEGRADLEPCGNLPENGIELSILVDQQAGRLTVMLPNADEPVADLTLSPAGNTPGGGVQLTVVTGTAGLNSLRVSRWPGSSLSRDDARQGLIRLRDGESFPAVVVGMEQGATVAVVRAVADTAGRELRRIPIDTVEEILFPDAGERTGDGRRNVRITDRYGSDLAGTLLRVERETVWLAHPACAEPIPLPIDTLATLTSLEPLAQERELPGRLGQLACQAGTLWGCLVRGDAVAGGDIPDAAAVAWQPQGSLTASPLAMPGNGIQPQATITYVESASSDGAASGADVGGVGGQIGVMNGRPAVAALMDGSPGQRAGVRVGDVIVAIAPRGDGRFLETDGLSMEDSQHLLRGRVGSRLQLRLQANGQGPSREVEVVRERLPQLAGNPQLLNQSLQSHDRLLAPELSRIDQMAPDWFDSRLILRTGENHPCRVEAIDEQGVRVRLPGAESVAVAGEWVQAVELLPAAARGIPAEKFRSLTTLPRSQRQQPPEHVVRSVQGDYLRGRLMALDSQTVRIAVDASPRDKPLAIPRADVARLIWLHPENLETPWKPPQPPTGPGLFVEGVGGNGYRLRVWATGIDGNLLLGRSPIVGPCRIDLEKTDRLVIGSAGTASQPSLPYAKWKLQPAPEPRNLPPRDARQP